MKSRIIIVMTLALLMGSGLSVAQQQEVKQVKHKKMSSTMHTNMGTLADITSKMYQLQSKDQIKPAQKTQMLGMMKELSQIFREMSVPHSKQVKENHKERLQEMLKRLENLYAQVGH